MDDKLRCTEYPAGPLGPGELRLLYLEPGQWSDEIHCRLVPAPLSNALTFDACSYAWGTSRRNRSITLDGLPNFAVTDNAFDMLRRLRHRQDCRALWVDALCINQKDLRERQRQVGIMGTIFSRASRCLVWLGEVLDPSDQTIVLDEPW